MVSWSTLHWNWVLQNGKYPERLVGKQMAFQLEGAALCQRLEEAKYRLCSRNRKK